MATRTANPADLLERVQALSERVDELADPQARELTQELVAGVIAMYGDGLTRIMQVIAGSREAGAAILDELSQDGAVASLLLIHDLYPISLEERVLEALDTVRPYMESHGGNVELVELRDGVAHLALQGSCNGCAASRATLETAIEQALEEHAPDLAGLEVAGVTEATTGFALPMAQAPTPAIALPVIPPAAPPRWVDVTEAARPDPGRLSEVRVGEDTLVLADINGALLAYVDECAACGEPLGDGRLAGGLLQCPSCEVEFDLPRAGRAAGGEPLQLRPVPLLQDGGLRVAL